MPKIFISYRRADSQARTEQIYERLSREFGRRNVFLDVEPGNIPEGEDFRRILREQVQQCDVLLVIIGQQWLDMRDAKNRDLRRLDNENDFVRIEVETGLNSSHIRTIPVLIDQTDPVDADALPESLRELAYKQARRVRGLPDFNADMGRLSAAIKRPSVPPQPNRLPLWITAAAGLLLLFAFYMLVLRETDEESASTPTTSAEINQPTEEVTEIVVEPTESPTERPSLTPTRTSVPTDTPTRTRTPTATSTPSATLELLTQIAMEFTQTKIAEDAFASATAAQWTYTPSSTPTPTATWTATPDYTQTYEKARDDFAATLTAESWTDTPTATLTPTLTEREKAFRLAEEGVSSNDEWTPYSEEINGVEMVLVPKGCFMMGSEEGEEDEKPVHEQCFDEPFWIDRTEVTRAMYETCVEAGACEAKTSNQYSENSDQPINTVNWFQAWDYCEWREARLPTEREWEYAARGPDNLNYPWGNEFVAENAVYGGNSGGQTAVVGSRPGGASWVGALDMSGNVWEWVSSLYREAYPYSEDWESNSDTNSVRGLRGGSWNDFDYYVRAAGRYGFNPDNEYNFIGFRCVLYL